MESDMEGAPDVQNRNSQLMYFAFHL